MSELGDASLARAWSAGGRASVPATSALAVSSAEASRPASEIPPPLPPDGAVLVVPPLDRTPPLPGTPPVSAAPPVPVVPAPPPTPPDPLAPPLRLSAVVPPVAFVPPVAAAPPDPVFAGLPVEESQAATRAARPRIRARQRLAGLGLEVVGLGMIFSPGLCRVATVSGQPVGATISSGPDYPDGSRTCARSGHFAHPEQARTDRRSSSSQTGYTCAWLPRPPVHVSGAESLRRSFHVLPFRPVKVANTIPAALENAAG